MSLSLPFGPSPINRSARGGEPADRAETRAWIIVNLHELCFAGFSPLDLTTRPDYAAIEQSYGGRRSREARLDHLGFRWNEPSIVSFIFLSIDSSNEATIQRRAEIFRLFRDFSGVT